MDKLSKAEQLLKALQGYGALSQDQLAAFIQEIATVFAQYRSATAAINKETKDVLNLALKQLNQEHERILNELENTKQETSTATSEAIKKALLECKMMCDEMSQMVPKDGENGKDGKDADNEYIIAELSKKMPEMPDMDAYNEEIEDKFKKVYDHIKKSINGFAGVRLLASLMDVLVSNPTNGQVLTYDSALGKWKNAASGGVGATFYVETPNEAVDGSRVDFTVDNTITTILSIHMNGQFIHPVDYSYAGTTITFTVAPDISYQGLPFTVVYA